MSGALPAIVEHSDTPLAQCWKQSLEQGRAALRTAFEEKPASPELLHKHCTLVDQLLRKVWQAHDLPASLALVAVGGYGRGQLFPHSDIDLLILLDQPADNTLQEKLQCLVGAWWDMGLETGHSVRTVGECVDIARQDITAQTNMLEPRLLTGNRKL
ncbi:MAG TPA: nucleotidyltransferase domain-containing protein, partial [Burkholderiales bacterium]|nr:nucleotidyltransferase domain-containing protein [Burkholderiales bacterium]